jgi:hypothetical protein
LLVFALILGCLPSTVSDRITMFNLAAAISDFFASVFQKCLAVAKTPQVQTFRQHILILHRCTHVGNLIVMCGFMLEFATLAIPPGCGGMGSR